MTFNPEGLFVELNMSNNVDYLDTIMKYQPNKTNLLGAIISILMVTRGWDLSF